MLKPLDPELISERWHYFEHASSNDGSWHYRLKVLKSLAQEAQRDTVRQIEQLRQNSCGHYNRDWINFSVCNECWQELKKLAEEAK